MTLLVNFLDQTEGVHIGALGFSANCLGESEKNSVTIPITSVVLDA